MKTSLLMKRVDTRGIGLVEVLVVGGVVGVLMTAMTSMMNYQMKYSAGIRIELRRDQLVTKLNQTIIDPASLANASVGALNSTIPMFKACLYGTAGTICSTPSATGFYLYDGVPAIVSGPPATPATYGNFTKGNCGIVAATASCPISISTTFFATCPTGGCVSGGTAQSVNISYTISQTVPGVGYGRIKTTTNTVTLGLPLTNIGTGNQNLLAKWVSATNLGGSGLSEDSSGNIGIGLTVGTAAQTKVDIAGAVTAGGPYASTNTTNMGANMLTSNDWSWGSYANIGTFYSPSSTWGIYLGAGVKQSPATTTSWISSLTTATTAARSALALDSSVLHLYSNVSANIALNTAVAMTEVFQFSLSGQSALKLGAASWSVLSDGRVKNIRAPFLLSLNEMEPIAPVYFNYKKNNPLGANSEIRYVGVVAQEVQKFIPEAISKDERGYLRLTPDAVYWTMLNGIKELHTELKKLLLSFSRLEGEELKVHLQKREQLKNEVLLLKVQNQSLLDRLIKVEGSLQ